MFSTNSLLDWFLIHCKEGLVTSCPEPILSPAICGASACKCTALKTKSCITAAAYGPFRVPEERILVRTTASMVHGMHSTRSEHACHNHIDCFICPGIDAVKATETPRAMVAELPTHYDQATARGILTTDTDGHPMPLPSKPDIRQAIKHISKALHNLAP
ncbi:hypothetical protein BO86DRAFT_152451 [Aspergillus japonicus CBS 114.51]|uniref:Uncharacterized protein n=1 Tax=Aspergillus japonicus CBS 114.51 TaxID=1448312 RepID=A0A8T8WUG0_ASPJA|nr:hypothetical protein BO86DRAFT_152451 [Aspergillus japonicus CBS 114.51]RAH79486.1 hypothetical protein BO86DRAFT_152451 [Aspergillus japonicus CBS 114.51]